MRGFETNTHQTTKRTEKRAVFYAGTDAIELGQGLTYNFAFTGTRRSDGSTVAAATDSWERDRYVQKPVPSATYEQYFAGVAAADYPANAAGQWIEIYEPGSYAQVATLIPTTVGVTRLTALAAGTGAPYTQGRFIAAGFPGKGSGIALQTLAVIASTSDLGVGVISSSLDGTASLAISGTTYTLTKTAAFTNLVGITLQGNEYVHIVAGATAADGTVKPTPGRYKITTVSSADAVILDPAGTAPAASTVDCNFYCVRGNPQVLVKLDEGPDESGLVEWVNPWNDGTTTTPVPSMVGGFSFIFGGFTNGTGDMIDTLADGTYPGQRKGWKLSGALTTNGYHVTVTTGRAIDVSQASLTLGYTATALGSIEFATDLDASMLVWNGSNWQIVAHKGAVVSASA